MRFGDENPLKIGSETWFKARYFSRRFCNRFWPRLGRVLGGFGEGLGRVLGGVGGSLAILGRCFGITFLGWRVEWASRRLLESIPHANPKK